MKWSKAGAFTLALPWLITFAIFWLFPIVYSFVIGFTDQQLLAKDYDWIGLDNYRALFTDPAFISSLESTFVFVFGTIPVTTIIALGMATRKPIPSMKTISRR